MKALTIQQVRQAVGGKALSAIPPASVQVQAVCTDTRHMRPASLFVAIVGETHDGHDFLPQAAAGGALAALVQRVPDNVQPNVCLIQVDDTRKALGRLARHARKQMKQTKVIAVAGSNGKTSTKHLIDAALCGRFRGSVSPKSYNNDIGVPLAIFPADPLQDYLVLEIGTNHRGEVQVLSDIALPDIAVITNCSAEHLEGLGDLMGVRQENASITAGLSPRGLLVLNGDDPHLVDAVSHYPGRKVTFGFESGGQNELFASDVHCDDTGTRFRVNNSRREVFVPLLGRHTACNTLAAIAVARRLGVPEAEIFDGLAEARGPEMRLQLLDLGPVRLLNDAYNANPASTRAALETLAALETPGRRFAVLGDMRELGHSTERYHREIGQFVAETAPDVLWCVGPHARLIAESAEKCGLPAGAIRSFDDSSAAAEAVGDRVADGDLVLLKGSRAMRLERVADALRQSVFARRRSLAG